METGLKDKVAIITGGSEGIGKGAAESMAREGANVVICARRKDVLEQAAKDVHQRTGRTVVPISADVTKLADIERVVNETTQRFGRIDILVNNAGTSASNAFESVDDTLWQSDLELKLFAAVRFSRLVIPYMKRQGGGRIINVTATPGKAPGAASMPTSVSRAAGIAFTKALSKELGPNNILVNTVCIGLIRSGQHETRWKKARQQEPNLTLDDYYVRIAKQRQVPLGRVGNELEAGDVICFLASERASYLSGIALNLDGGQCPVV